MCLQVRNCIVHIIPSDDLRIRQAPRLATPYTSNLVYQKLTRISMDDVLGFLKGTRGDHACGAIRGQLFESYVMHRQSKASGKEFQVKLPEGFSAGEFLAMQASKEPNI